MKIKANNCPITRSEFTELAQPIKVVIDDYEMMAEVKEFSTGSLGWYLNNKMTIKIGDKPVRVQVGLNLTIVGSKDLPTYVSVDPPEAKSKDAYADAFGLAAKDESQKTE